MPIRFATAADAEAIAAIYAYHVAHGTATFDTAAPPPEFFAAKIAEVPIFLVAEEDGVVAGYAYAAQFRPRPAYAGTCENSIYVREDRRGQGIGGALLDALIERATAHGFRQMLAVISDADASACFHARAGFRDAGRIESVGRKFGRWIDVHFMQRALGPGDGEPPEIEP